MKLLFTFLLLLLVSVGYAQKCNCISELKFLEQKTEQDLPSYYDQVVLQQRHVPYYKHKKECDAIAASTTDSAQCIYLLAKYLSFFRDEHLSVNYKESAYTFSWDDNDTAGMRLFFARERKYPIPPLPYKQKGLEGLWQSRDNKMIVQMVKQKEKLWDYAGLIITGDPKFWTRGQLKFYLKHKTSNLYECMYLSGSRRPRVVTAMLSDSILQFGRLTDFHRIRDTSEKRFVQNANPGDKLEFRQLSAKTNYLRIPDFSFELFEQIDSFIKANNEKILSKPKLVIDVRGNGGGADRCYYPLLDFIMDKKEISAPMSASMYASEGLIDYYTKNKYKYCTTREDSLDEDTSLIIMQQHSGKFTPYRFASATMDTVYAYPQKIVILMDRWCASSTEGFIMTAMQSGKVILAGENTWGCCTYGDLITVDMPCLPVEINMPTKKMHMKDGKDYESLGIVPQLVLKPEQSAAWVKEAQDHLEQ